MLDSFLVAVSHIPDPLVVMLIGASPLLEFYTGFSVGFSLLDLSVLEAFVFSLAGSLFSLVVIFSLLPSVLEWLSVHSPRVHNLFEKRFFRVIHKHQNKLDKYGALFLFIFIAVPYPTSGVWTASAIAILLKMNIRYALPAIIAGLIVAGLVVALPLLLFGV